MTDRVLFLEIVTWHIFLYYTNVQKFQLNVVDNKEITSIWANHLTREDGFTKKGKPKFKTLSYGIKNGEIHTEINTEPIVWENLSPFEQASTTEKLKPLKWLLQK